MKGKTTLILAGIFVALALYVYFFEVKGKAEKERAEAKAKKVFQWEKQNVQKITLKRSSGTVVCVRDSNEWQLLSPIKTVADKSTINSMLSSLIDTKIERKLEGVKTLADFGLAPPKFTVILTSKDNKSDTLFFGNKNPTKTYLYAKRPGESGVFLTGTSLSYYLTKKVFDFRDKTVLPFSKKDIKQITLKHKGRKDIVISKEGDGWKIISPIETQADKSAVDELLNKVKWAKAKSYEDEKPKNLRKYGLTHPVITLILTIGKERAEKQLLIGKKKKDDRYYAKDVTRPPVFTVDNNFVKGLNKTLFDLRDKKIVHFNREETHSLTITYKDKPTFACQKDTAGDWYIQSPKKVKAKSWKISSIITKIEDLKAKKFIGKVSSKFHRYGLKSPRLEVFLKDKDGKKIVDIVFGKKAGKDQVYVMNRIINWVYRVDNSIIKDLTPDIKDFAAEEKAKTKAK